MVLVQRSWWKWWESNNRNAKNYRNEVILSPNESNNRAINCRKVKMVNSLIMESDNSRWWYCQHIAARGNEDHKNA